MFLKRIIFCTVLLHFLGENSSHIINKILTEHECETICSKSEGLPDFNTEDKLCRCILTKPADDADLSLIQKHASSLGKKLHSVERVGPKVVVIKREIPTATENTLETTPETTSTTVGTTPTSEQLPIETTKSENVGAANKEIDAEPNKENSEATKKEAETANKEDDGFPIFEEVVGQQSPHRRIHPRPVITPRPTPRRPREPRPLTPEQQRITIQQIHDHLNRLSQLSEHRLRQMEIEAIKTNLRQLSNTVLVQHPTTPQRPNLRNAVEEARRRRLHAQHGRIVGAANPGETSTEKEDEVESAVKEIFHGKKHHFEIITQDPSLIDE